MIKVILLCSATLFCNMGRLDPSYIHTNTLVIRSIVQEEEKPKKEILISMRSNFYQNASSVIESVFKQANINDFSIDEKVKDIKAKNIQFRNKTLSQSLDILSKFYNVKFEITDVGKDKFYSVTVK